MGEDPLHERGAGYGLPAQPPAIGNGILLQTHHGCLYEQDYQRGERLYIVRSELRHYNEPGIQHQPDGYTRKDEGLLLDTVRQHVQDIQ